MAKKKIIFLFLIDLKDNSCKIIIPTMYVIVYAYDVCTYICINIYIYMLILSEMNNSSDTMPRREELHIPENPQNVQYQEWILTEIMDFSDNEHSSVITNVPSGGGCW